MSLNIQTIINEIVEENNQYKGGLRNNGKFSISDAGTCYRARIYKRMGVEPTRTIPIENLRKMVAGDAGHEKLQNLLWRGKKMFLSENEVEDEHRLGHPDGIIKSGGIKHLIEIKTIEKWGMGWIKKQGAKHEHVLQMMTYWVLLRKDIVDLNRAVLSYVKREDFEAKDFYFLWNNDIERQVDEEWQPLIKHWLDKTLPDCTCAEMYNGNGAKYCRYATSETECCDEKLFQK